MLADPSRLPPVRIDDPTAYPAGSAHIATLAVEGPGLTFDPFAHAVCALAREHRDTRLDTVSIADWVTVFVTYADGLVCQFELVYSDDCLEVLHIDALKQCRRDDVDQLIVATAGQVSANAKVLCQPDGVGLIQMDADRRPRTGPWRRDRPDE